MMAMCCDHRVMSSAGTIGLNEVRSSTAMPSAKAACSLGAKAMDFLSIGTLSSSFLKPLCLGVLGSAVCTL